MTPRSSLRIHDAHRVLGPLPHDTVPTATLAGLVADLDDLGVSSCSASMAWQVFGDPSGRGHARAEGDDPLLAHPRVVGVPVIVPALGGSGWPDDASLLVAAGVRLVRACPVRHRWSLDSGSAHRWWETLAPARCAVALDVAEVGFGAVRALARSHPELTLVLLSPGYRELRRCADVLSDFANTVVETGSLNTFGGVEWLAGVGGSDRLLFGTGGPVHDDAGATHLLRCLELPEADVERIAYGTAVTLGLVAA